ncbi:CHAT domain-containing protein [Nodosilinea sp. LEGE 07088]|uniref:CHAT domain-containing protein n=1 Tax=Nodosilinea sp. LEGE 07088 TaxID=2777968 RepID=UPI0018825913|nr:CHAT domain-containing protein [Nodosilinea sp. LEGE 07088]MBE9137039.1 CHAT domain-containing protein [Nodosilinea sp. LEGE 07088]
MANPIVPANDGTGTVVNVEGNEYVITGGTLSGDSANLFHSLQQLGLSQGEIANFLSQPQVQNIITRVVGGNVSVIDGLLQVSGGNANLFILNPAGVIFGPNSSLNLPASFTVSTANRLGFGDNWLEACGSHDYASLTGSPDAFAFDLSQPGMILNAGELAVATGQDITLVAGEVVNTGTLTASDGNITLTAVPGESIVRISHADSLVSLEISPVETSQGTGLGWSLVPTDLPNLLTGGDVTSATGLVANADGTVGLTGSNFVYQPQTGTVIAAGEIDTSGESGGEIAIVGDRVGLASATVNASGSNGGGTVRIGGDYQGQGTVPNASRTFVDEATTIAADALNSGDGGQVIIWADEATQFDGTISARGGPEAGNGGFVEVSGQETLAFRGNVDTSAANGEVGTLLLDPENIEIVAGESGSNDPELSDGQILDEESPGNTFTISENALERLSAGTNLTLEASNSITIVGLSDGNLSFPTTPGATIRFEAGETFSMNSDDTISTQGGNLTVIAGTNITLGRIDMASGGDLTLRSNEINLNGGNGSIQTRDDPDSSCCLVTLSPPGGSLIDVVVGGGTDTGDNVLDITESDLGAFSTDPNSSIVPAVYAILSNRNLTIPAALNDQSLDFNRNLTLRAEDTLTIERPLDVEGPISLQGGEINLLGTPDSIQATGGGSFANIQLLSGDGRDIVVAGDPNIDTPNALDLTEQELATLQPSSGRITVGRLDNRPDFQVGNIIVGDGINTTPLAFNQTVSVIQFQTNTGRVNIQRPINASNTLVIEAADIDLGAVVTAENVELSPPNLETSIGLGDNAIGDFNLSTTELTDNLNVNGTVTIGEDVLNAPPNSNFGPVQLSNLENLVNETYSLTIRGGDFSFAGGSQSNAPTIRLAENETLALISAGTITEGSGIDIQIDGASGNLLLDAATGIRGGTGGLDISVANIAARTRNSGDIALTLRSADLAPAITPTISTVTYERPFAEPPITTLSGLTTAPNGSIFLGYLNGVDGNINIAEPVQARGSGDITLGNRQNGQGRPTLLLNSEVTSEAGNITFASPVILGAGGGNIISQSGSVTFAAPIEGAQGLRVAASNGNVLFSAAVGEDASGTASLLAGLSINAVNVVAQSIVNVGIEGLAIAASGTVDFENAVTSSGRVSVAASGNVRTNDITSAGEISITSTNGSVITDNLDSSGTAGNSITINALTQVITGSINTSGATGRGGDVIIDPIADVQVSFINAQGGLDGVGGVVDITAGQFFRALETFTDQNGIEASLSTAGGQGGGAITIRHGGGGRATPFVIGDATINGTAGAISTGFSNSLIPFQAITFPLIQGILPEQIAILTSASSEVPQVIDEEILEDNATSDNETEPSSENEAETVSLITLIPPSEEVVEAVVEAIDEEFTRQYEEHYDRDLTPETNQSSAQTSPSETGAETTLPSQSEQGQMPSPSVDVEPAPPADSDFGSPTAPSSPAQPSSPAAPGIVLEPTPESDIELTSPGNQQSDSSPSGEDLPGGQPATTPANVEQPPHGVMEPASSPDSEDVAEQPPEAESTSPAIDEESEPVPQENPGGASQDADNSSEEEPPSISETFEPSANDESSPSTDPASDDLVEPSQSEPDDGEPAIPGSSDTPVLPAIEPLGSMPASPDDSPQGEAGSGTSQPNQPGEEASPSDSTLKIAQQALRDVQNAANIQPAIIYAFFIPPNTIDSLEALGNGPIPLSEDGIAALEAQAKSVELSNLIAQSLSAESCNGREDYWLSVILVTPAGEATWQALPNTTCTGVIDVARYMRTEILERDDDYLEPAQALFNWLIAPIEQSLDTHSINNLVFIADQGLRAVPLAALHDGEQYLIENYSVGMMPSLALTDTNYQDVRQSQILISGISNFEFTDLENLDAVPLEIDTISSQWAGTSLVEDEVTQANLVNERRARRIVHLATHAKFEPGDASQSYIQLWGEKLRLNEVPQMGWDNPVIEMLVLSACETASDSRDVELGFAGFASQAGVKSTVASLWTVEDLGTAALMAEFYQGLRTLPIKAESLRRAQLALLDGDVQVEEGRLLSENFEKILPEELLGALQRSSFRFAHPYYWSGFTIVGNPW